MGRKRRKNKERDYEVGYGRPPKHSQFKKGQSGNPKGRPKEPTTFLASFNKELSKDVKVVIDGQECKITGLSAVSKKYKNMILSGDYKCMKLFLDKTANNVNIDPYLYPEPEFDDDAELVPENPTDEQREAIQEIKAIIRQAMREKLANGEKIYDDKPKE